ncbi:MAG: DUF547 domain-containing protein [Kofleriaceae bacterium]
MLSILAAMIGCKKQQVAIPPEAREARELPAIDAEHSQLAPVLTRSVRPTGVDYAALRANHADLDTYRAQLAAATIPEAPAEKMALYINAYNAWTLALVIEKLPTDPAAWPAWSIKDAGSLTQNVWKTFEFELAGKRYTLDALEHELLRPMGDPRIHFAINCASKSCPPLAATPYTAAGLERQLADAVKVFVDDPTQLRLKGKSLQVNPILDWFKDDFKAGGGVAAFLKQHVTTPAVRAHLAAGGDFTYFDYDWRLNLATP